MATFHFHHSFIGRTTHAAGTAMAHARYIMREKQLVRAFSENMPRQYHAVQRWLDNRETTIRKNGRVSDRFIGSIPREFTPEQAEGFVRRFCRTAGKGVVPFFCAIHDPTWHNPHAHIIFVDAHVETGKRVFQTSEKGSTERLRSLWEKVCNDELERCGFDARIDGRSKRDRLLAQEWNQSQDSPALDPGESGSSPALTEPQRIDPTPLEAPAAADPSEDVGQLHPDAPAEELEPEPEEAHESVQVEQDDADMSDVPEGAVGYAGRDQRTAANRIIMASHLGRDLLYLRETRSEIDMLNATLEGLRKRREAAERVAERSQEAARGFAKARVETKVATRHLFTREDKKRGFSVFGWESPTRKRASQAEKLMADQQRNMVETQDHAMRSREEANYVARQEFKVSAREQELTDELSRRLSTKGTEQELAQAEEALSEGVQHELEDISAEQIVAMFEAGEVPQEQAEIALQVLGAQLELEQVRGDGMEM